MVDAQRNVIMKLSLEADSKNQATAKLVESQVNSVVTAGSKSYEELRTMASSVQKQISEIHKVQSDLRLGIDRQSQDEQIAILNQNQNRLISLEERKTDLMEKAASDRQKSLDMADKKRQDAAEKKRLKAAKDFEKKLNDIERSRVENTQRANEAAVAAVQGIADVVEGMAKLGLISEDNLQKFLKQFVMIPEGMRVFKGATDLIWKGREALIALSAATNAQTTANNLMAASAGRAAVAQGAAGATGGSGGGAIGGAVAGGTVVGGAKILGGYALAAGKVLSVALAGAEAFQFLRRQIFGASEASESIVGAMWDLSDASNQAEEAIKRTARAEKLKADLLNERNAATKEGVTRTSLQSQLRESRNRVSEASSLYGNASDIQNANRLRVDAIREVRAAEKELSELDKYDQQRKEKGLNQAKELRLQFLSDQEVAQKRLYDAEVNRLNVIQTQNKETQKALDTERERLANAQEAKRVEERGLNAKLGQLSPGMQRQAIAVAEKVKRGEELSQRDIAVLKEAGTGQEQIDDYYEKKGKRVKGSDVFTEVFGSRKTKAEIADAEQRSKGLEKDLAAGQQQESAAGQSLLQSAGALNQATQARVKFEADLRLFFSEQVKGLQASAQQIRQATADATDAIQQQGMASIDAVKSMQEQFLKYQSDMQKQFEQVDLIQNNYSPGKIG